MPKLRFLFNTDAGEDGQALVEYGLILALVALVAITGLTAAAGGVDGLYGTFTTLTDAIKRALA